MATESSPDNETQPLDTAALDSSEGPPPRSSHPSYIGMVVKDRYQIEKEIGRGGFGAVFLAKDRQLLGKLVVIKVLLQDGLSDPWFMKKFAQEIEALSRINHPGVVGVVDAGEMEGGKPYLVMQFVEGSVLRKSIDATGMDLERTAAIVRQVGQALTAAHDKGICHRDLKPENIMLNLRSEGEDRATLIDFGIASVQNSQVAAKSPETRLAGSFAYMAPEQFEGKPTPLSDIYALGVIAYEMVTGRAPFAPSSLYQFLAMQREGVKVKPKDLRPDLPEAAQELILKALNYKAEDRFKSAREFGEKLAKAIIEAPESKPAGIAPTETIQQQREPKLEMAHVLFMDIVGYSALAMDQQTRCGEQLKAIVQGTATYRKAQAQRELTTLPTGDGMALGFIGDPTAPVECALEVARELKKTPQFGLRMGVNTGPVYRVADINAQLNLAGGGINRAQRVMDCGDAGHILVSKSVAEVLDQLSGYAGQLHDLGEHPVKHGERIHMFNLVAGDAGNPQWPSRLARSGTPSKPQPVIKPPKPATPSRFSLAQVVAVLALAVAILSLTPVVWKGIFPDPPPPPPPAERVLTYSVTVQGYRNGKPYKEPYQLSREVVFAAGDHVYLTLESPQAGYLYIINEGPRTKDNMPMYMTLFPSTRTNAGSSLLSAARSLRIPEQFFIFDEEEGTEKLWLVWSEKELAVLEALKQLTNVEHKGLVTDPDQIRVVQDLLGKYSALKAKAERDDLKKQTILRARTDPLVHVIALEHH